MSESLRTIFSAFLLLTSATALGAANFRAVSETEIVKALHEYQEISELQVKFKQSKILHDMDLKLVSEGSLQLNPPGRVLFSISKPAHLAVTLTPEEIRIESGEGATRTTQTIKTSDIPTAKEKASLAAMVTWLKLDAKELSKNYEISTNESRIYRFVPRVKESSPFQSLEMALGQDGHLTALTMNEDSGDHIEFQFEKPVIKYGKHVSDKIKK